MSRSQARHPELAAFLESNAIRLGSFKLSSGQTSDYYCDGKLASFSPKGSNLIADAILRELSALDEMPAAIGGMDMGATPIVSVVACRSEQIGRPIPSFTVRKEAKAHGTKKRIEGLLPEVPSTVVIVDDVVTSGGSIREAIQAVREHGHTVVLAISVLDRGSGGDDAMASMGVPYQPLVRISELGVGNGDSRRNGSTGSRDAESFGIEAARPALL